MPEILKDVFQFVKDYKELLVLVASIIGLIAAIVSRTRVVIHIQQTQSVPVNPTGSKSRDKQLAISQSIKRSLGLLIGCLIGLIISVTAFWYFNGEMQTFRDEHPKWDNPNWGGSWGQGEGLEALRMLAFVGACAWGFGAVSMMLRFVFLSLGRWQLARKSAKGIP